MRGNNSASHPSILTCDAIEHPRPQAGREQVPIRLREGRNVVLAQDHIVPACAPGEGEIGDVMVEGSRLEVENTGNLITDEHQVAQDDIRWQTESL